MTRREWFEFIAHLGSVDLQKDSTEIATFLEAPKAFPETSAEASPSAVLSIQLDWLIHVGGTVRRDLESHIKKQLMSASEIHFEIRMRPDPVLSFEVDAWLKTFMQPIRKVFVTPANLRAAWVSSVPRLRSFEWSEPSDALEFEFEATKMSILPAVEATHLATFEREMSEAEVERNEPPWVYWSRLPGWLSHRKLREDHRDVLFPLECRLAFLRCVLSPQDEVSEGESLAPDALMVNPTFEIVERPLALQKAREAPLVAFSRQSTTVSHRVLTALEAMILDQTREAFRANLDVVVGEISNDSGVRKEFVQASIEGLEIDGFLLGKIDDGGSANVQ